jgi:hypothetical protein
VINFIIRYVWNPIVHEYERRDEFAELTFRPVYRQSTIDVSKMEREYILIDAKQHREKQL